MSPRTWWTRLGHGRSLVLAVVYCLFPIYFMLVQSLKTAQEDVFGNPLIVMNPTFENFEELFEREGEAGASWAACCAGRIRSRSGWRTRSWSSPARSPDARGQRGRRLRARPAAPAGLPVVASGHLRHVRDPADDPLRAAVPGGERLGLDDNLLALLLIYPTMALPFCVWMLSAYFQHLPREIEEAALIEGASRVTAFFRIILPMSRPVLVAAGIFTLGTIASDFMIASVFLLSAHNQTIPAGLGTVEVALDELMAVAGINLMAIPVVLISAAFARGYVRGLTAAMVEGA